MNNKLTYVLITPARNEAEFIELTIKSMIVQTQLPLRWIIVSDGSTDGTDDIVKKYLPDHDWMELVRTPERKERHFAGKVFAFNAGYEKVKDMVFDVIGSLDADISFDPEYFSFLMNKFMQHPELGVAGTPFREGNKQYDYRFTNIEHVSGACQLFRKACFESIGGYTPLKLGGIDLVAVTTARMKGWKTRTFTEKISQHHKMTQSDKNPNLGATFKSGYHDYLMGSSPLWQICRSIYQMTNKPFLLRGFCFLAGYFWAMMKRAERPVSKEFVKFRRQEQFNRLRDIVFRRT